MNFYIENYNDILTSIRPIITVSQIFGVMPFTQRQYTKLTLSKPSFFYSSCLFVVSLIHALLMPLYVIYLNDPRSHRRNSTKDTVKHIINILDGEGLGIANNKNAIQTIAMKVINPVLLNVMCLSARWISIIKIPAEFPKIINDLYEADMFLRNKFSVEYSKINKKQRDYCFQTVIFYTSMGVAINFYYYIVGVWQFWGLSFTVMWCTLLAMANVTAMVMELQFVNFVNLLKVRFEILNEKINSHIKEEEKSNLFYRSRKTFNKDYYTKISSLSSSVTNDFLLTDLGISRDSKSLTKMIEEARQFHHKLCGLVASVNSLYHLQLLSSLIAVFVRGVLNVYFGIFGQASTTGYGSSASEFSGVLNMVLWSSYYMLRFSNIIISADNLTYEAHKARPLVAAINNRFLDDECKEELLLFSNYMASCKAEFTAYGFFSLNMGLITSAIGAGTTYLVILVQFHTTENIN